MDVETNAVPECFNGITFSKEAQKESHLYLIAIHPQMYVHILYEWRTRINVGLCLTLGPETDCCYFKSNLPTSETTAACLLPSNN